jgi:uncharacterized protein (TIGR02145 family)
MRFIHGDGIAHILAPIALCLGVSSLPTTGAGEADTANKTGDAVRVGDMTVTDVGGNVYRTVAIGDQVWMAENLKVIRYRDSSAIPCVVADSIWSGLKSGAYCWGSDDSTDYRVTYGALYNFYAVDDACGLCPKGWHVPTQAEWLTLETYWGGPEVAGGKAKEQGTLHWNPPNVGATDASGFAGLQAGGRGRLGGPGEIGKYATWWSSTGHDSSYAWHWGLWTGDARVRSNPGHKTSGFPVRCVKD